MRLGADFKKLIQIGRDNAQIAQALQYGHILTRRPAQNPLIESHQAVVAIEQVRVRGIMKRFARVFQWDVLLGIGGE